MKRKWGYNNRQNGMILVTTLWILALLTLLALGIGIRVGIDIKLIGFSINSLKAHYIAEAGLRKTIALIEKDDNKNVDSLNEIWSCGFDFEDEVQVLKNIAIGEGVFTVSHYSGEDEEGSPIYLYGASDEEGKLNINELDENMLLKLPNVSFEVAQAILDWRDEDSLPRLEGAEESDYEELDNSYECKDGKFSVPEELLLVKGVTKEIYDGIKDVITVYGESKAANINTASEEVLSVLIGGELAELPGKIVRYRNGDDGLPGTKDDNIFTDTRAIVVKLKAPLASGGGLTPAEELCLNDLITNKQCFKVNSNIFRIASRGEVREGRVKKTIETVVKRGKDKSEILYYYED